MTRQHVVPASPVRSPTPVPSGTGGSTPGVPGWIGGYVHWASGLSEHLTWLWRHIPALWWPWVPVLAAVAVLGTIAVSTARTAAWRKVTAGAYWVAITPPRSVEPADWAKVWRRLGQLAPRARGPRWRLARPPLAFEVYATDGGLTAGVWLPGWVRYPDAASEIAMAWPGATVARTEPPTMDSAGRLAGYRLGASAFHPDTGWLVDDTHTPAIPRTGTDPMLGRMFTALGDPGGPAVAQVLIRPVGRRRRAHLRAASVRPVKPYRSGGRRVGDAVLWLLHGIPRLLFGFWDFWTTKSSNSSARRVGREPADPVQVEAMRQARAKLSTPPHLLVCVRVGAVRARRDDARAAAQSIAAGFGDATAWLEPMRLPRPATALISRRARGPQWLLMTGAELGILAHLPPDPGRYRFDTTALVRPLPRHFRRADPERPTRRDPGWTGHGWSTPPAPPPGGATDHNGGGPDATDPFDDNETDPSDDDGGTEEET